MHPNTIITAQVTEVLERGIHLEADGQPGFINVTELTWKQRGPHRAADFAAVGDTLEVVVYATDDNGFLASVKQLRPEDDPWRDHRIVAPRSHHHGVAYQCVDFGVFVELDCGIVGLLRPAGAAFAGEMVEVEVTEVDLALKKVGLSRR